MVDRTGPQSLAPRSDFPVLDEVTYLNTGSIGLVALQVQREAQAFAQDIAGRGTVGFDDAAETHVYDRARSAAARLIGADEDDIAITTSATEALAQVAWWLRPGAGTNIVSLDIEFPSVTYPWLRVSEETGAEVRLAKASADPAALTLDDVARLVDERTAVICISHVQYATGLRFDPAALALLAHAYGAVLVLDATQSAGAVPLDVRSVDIDVLVAGAYKWLCSSFGASICYLRRDIRERLRPPFVGWRSTVDPFVFDATRLSLASQARKLEYSTRAYESSVALAAAIDYLLDLGIDRILAHDLALGSLLIDGLDALGAEIVTPRGSHLRAGIVTARFPDRDGAHIAARLTAAGVIVSPRFDATRFSLHMFNDANDVAHALNVLGTLI